MSPGLTATEIQCLSNYMRRRRVLTIGLARAGQHLWRAPCGRGASRLAAHYLDKVDPARPAEIPPL